MPAPRFHEAPPAFLFFGVFTGIPELFDRVRRGIVEAFGPLHPEGESPSWDFPETHTYGKTMGPGLRRRFYFLDRLWPQDRLAEVKRAAVELEAAIGRERDWPVERPVNIDPGLLNDCRVILASTKDNAHRIYRGQGIWEEVTLVYERGGYRDLPWTYRDFRSPAYHDLFRRFRRELLARTRGRETAAEEGPETGA